MQIENIMKNGTVRNDMTGVAVPVGTAGVYEIINGMKRKGKRTNEQMEKTSQQAACDNDVNRRIL